MGYINFGGFFLCFQGGRISTSHSIAAKMEPFTCAFQSIDFQSWNSRVGLNLSRVHVCVSNVSVSVCIYMYIFVLRFNRCTVGVAA